MQFFFFSILDNDYHIPACTRVRLWVWSLGREDPLEEEMAPHSSTLAWKIPWAEEPGGLCSSWGHKESYMTDDWAHTTTRLRLAIYKTITNIFINDSELKDISEFCYWGMGQIYGRLMGFWLSHLSKIRQLTRSSHEKYVFEMWHICLLHIFPWLLKEARNCAHTHTHTSLISLLVTLS